MLWMWTNWLFWYNEQVLSEVTFLHDFSNLQHNAEPELNYYSIGIEIDQHLFISTFIIWRHVLEAGTRTHYSSFP